MSINWTEIIISLCSLLITGVIVPFVVTKSKKVKSELSESQLEIITYWTKIGVKWAKQWLHSYEGEAKKDRVLEYVAEKMRALNLDISLDDLDKIIEAVYGDIKDELEKYQNKGVLIESENETIRVDS